MKLFRVFILAILTTTLIACGGAEERKSVYLEKAKTSFKAGNFDKARIELKNALQIDPKYAEAYYLIGKVYEESHDYRKAFANYKKAEDLNPELLDNQAMLGMFYLFLINDTEKTQEKIDFILTRDPDNSDGLYLKAAMAAKNNNDKDAIKIAEKIVSKDPGNIDATVFLVALYEKHKRSEDALKILDAALKNNSSNVKLNKLLGLILVKNKDYARAENVYKTLLDGDSDNRMSYKTLAAFYNESGDKAKAEQVLRDSIKNNSDDADRYFDLLKYISLVDGNEAAINELKAFIKSKPYIGKLRIALGEYLYINNKQEEAIDVYKDAIKDFSDEKIGVDARITLATIYMSRKNLDDAKKVIEDALLISPNDPMVNLLAAKIALYDNNAEKAIIALRIVNKEAPDKIEAYVLLTKAYQLNGDTEQAKNALNNAYENNRTNPTALLQLAQLYMSSDTDKAEKIIDEYNNLQGFDYKGLSAKAAMLNKRKAFSEAKEVAEKIMSKYPDKPNGYLQVYSYYNNKKEFQTASSILEKGYVAVKQNRDILMLLSSIQVKEKKFNVVENRIKKEIKSSPDDAILITLLAKVYLEKGDTKSATALLDDLVDRKTTLEEPYLLLSNLYTKQKNINSTTEILEKGVKNAASKTKISLRLATIYEFNKNYRKAIKVYQDLYDKDPNTLIVVNNLVSLLSDHGDGKADIKRAMTMVGVLERSGNMIFLDTVGWLHFKSGDYKNAIKDLKKIVEKSPNINIFNYHLGMAYKMSGDKAKAKIYLEKSLANGKRFNEKDLAKAALESL